MMSSSMKLMLTLLTILTSAPELINFSTTSVRPYLEAKWMGVYPFYKDNILFFHHQQVYIINI